MKSILVTACIIVLSTFSINAQNDQLERKCNLGAQIQPSPKGSGMLILQVFESTTAQSAGLTKGDILVKINEQKINSVADIGSSFTGISEGDPMKFDIIRNGEALALNVKARSKPLEDPPHGRVVYGSVPYKGGLLRSILNLPEDRDNPPVVFFLQGYSCASIDYFYNAQHPVRQLVEGLVAEGFAVYRVEKPGLGDSYGTPQCNEIGFHEEVDAFLVSLRHLKSISAIDPDRVFLFGHSLGGLTAPRIAADEEVMGIINYGSSAITWYEYLFKVLRKQAVIMGQGYETIEANVRARTPLLYDYLIARKSLEELKAHPEYVDLLSTGLPYIQGDLVLGRHPDFMPEVNETNIVQAFKRAGCHVLAIHGACDLAAVDDEWIHETAEIVNAFHPGKGSYHLLEDTQHAFVKVPGMEEYFAMRSDGRFNGEYMNDHFNYELVDVVADWINQVLEK